MAKFSQKISNNFNMFNNLAFFLYCLNDSLILASRGQKVRPAIHPRCHIQAFLIKTRRNFSLAARYSLRFTRRSLQNSLATRCRKSLVTRYKFSSLLVTEVAHCKKCLVTRCEIHSLLVAEVSRCKKSLVTSCKIRSLLVAEVVRYKNSLVTRCIIRLFIT